MADAQFIGLFFGLLLIMIITEMGLLTVCDRLKTIVRLLEKLEKRIKKEGGIIVDSFLYCPSCGAEMKGAGENA